MRQGHNRMQWLTNAMIPCWLAVLAESLWVRSVAHKRAGRRKRDMCLLHAKATAKDTVASWPSQRPTKPSG